MEAFIRFQINNVYRRIQNIENTRQIIRNDYYDALNNEETLELILSYEKSLKYYNRYIRYLYSEIRFWEMRILFPATGSS